MSYQHLTRPEKKFTKWNMAQFRETVVWQKSYIIVQAVYRLTEHFPKNQYKLADQMQRAAVSVLSNVAEGWRRSHKEWKNFMRIAFGSAGELESQLLVAKSLGYAKEEMFQPIFDELEHVSRILNACVHKKS